MIERIVIIGAGQAGVQAAVSLRARGYDGAMTLVGDEQHAPYQRPPLSKAFLTGKTDAGRLMLKGEAFYADAKIELIRGIAATRLDRDTQHVILHDGRRLAYDRVVLAMGARPFALPLPGADLDGVVMLRGLDDATQIRARLTKPLRAVIIGGGFIGLECAASLVRLGHDVSVIEAQSRLMARAVSKPISDAFASLHRAEGVELKLGAEVARIIGKNGNVTGVESKAGETLPADLVIIGVGVVPNCELAEQAGLAVANGIIVDAHLATADPHVLAIGDCAAFPSLHTGTMIRIESVQNAIDQGKAVAATILGQPSPYRSTPWFWSDQYESKLQIAGLGQAADQHVMRGDPASGRFSIFAYAKGHLVAVESVNRPADHMLARRLLDAGLSPEPSQVSDEAQDLKALLLL
jgi:3-phenylpropionate/trans-cinnamate dioxygenase ferredoxin reductase component